MCDNHNRMWGGHIPLILEGTMEEVKIIGQMDNTLDNTFESANRVYDKNGLCPTIPTCAGGGHQPKVIEDIHCVAMRGRNPEHPTDRTPGIHTEQRLEMNKDGLVNTLTTVQKDNLVLEGVKNEDEREENLLQILRGRIEKEAFCKWAIRGLFCILQTQILQQNVYAERLFENWKQSADMGQFTSDGTIDKFFVITEENLRNLWKDWQVRCTPYRRQFSEQQSEQFTNYMQELPYEDSQNKRYLQDLREASEGIGILQQALYQIQEIWESSICKVQYRIRKLTPRETWRLMGYTDRDFEKAAEVNSNTQLYRESGNAIVKQVMMAIFLQMGIKGLKKWEERSEEEKAELIRGSIYDKADFQ